MFKNAEIICVIFILGVLCFSVSAQDLPKKGSAPKTIYGLTIENLDSLNTSDFSDRFKDVLVPITIRIVFQRKTLPSDYKVNLETLYGLKDKDGIRRFYLMALLFDSEALKEYKLKENSENNYDCRKFEKDNMNYNQRAKCFIEMLKGNIDMWEVGNEVNGEWADEKYKKNRDESFVGDFSKTIKKIDTVIKLVPNDKPLALTLSYMPNCGEWKDNAMDKWIQHFHQSTIVKLDYVLVSYYEDKCNYRVLNENEINNDVFAELRRVFKNQFLGMGEIGYSEGDGVSSQTCLNDPNCYCSTMKTYCDEASNTAPTGNKSICKKSKISQMQRYYSMRPTDKLFIGGGFWWNAQNDYVVPGFLSALISEFNCLSKNLPCDITPVDCRSQNNIIPRLITAMSK